MALPLGLVLFKLLLPFLLSRVAIPSFVVKANIRLHPRRGDLSARLVVVQHRQSPQKDAPTDAVSRSHIACTKRNDTPFWGSNRTKQEIQDFCHRAVFHDSSSTLNMSLSTSATVAADKVMVINSEPPLVIIHDFLSPEECEVLIVAATHQDLQRSTTGATQETTEIRTSSTTWLRDEGDGASDARKSDTNHVLRSFAQRVSRLSGLPPENMENLQIIHYVETQQFDIHTDHIDSFNDLHARGRLATCLVYLNDGYQGGETFFPEYHMSVKANKGSALFFWNTLERPGMKNYEPYMFLNVDKRLRHAGLPVINGVKWACNRWVHPIKYGAGVRGL